MLTFESLIKAIQYESATGQGRHYADGRHERRRPVATDYAALPDYTPARIWNDETKTFDTPATPERPNDEPCAVWDEALQDFIFR